MPAWCAAFPPACARVLQILPAVCSTVWLLSSGRCLWSCARAPVTLVASTEGPSVLLSQAEKLASIFGTGACAAPAFRARMQPALEACY